MNIGPARYEGAIAANIPVQGDIGLDTVDHDLGQRTARKPAQIL